MSFFISEAYAEAAPGIQPGLEGIIFPLGVLLFFYFLFLRPQAKRSKEQKQMLAALTKGAEVVTTGGILGKVFDLDENFVKLEVSENSFIQVQRHAIANLMPKGTYKALSVKKPKI
jgi:preprotein translocase subunit YajC